MPTYRKGEYEHGEEDPYLIPTCKNAEGFYMHLARVIEESKRKWDGTFVNTTGQIVAQVKKMDIRLDDTTRIKANVLIKNPKGTDESLGDVSGLFMHEGHLILGHLVHKQHLCQGVRLLNKRFIDPGKCPNFEYRIGVLESLLS